MFCAGSRVDHAPEYPLLSRTVIEPPALGAEVAMAPVDVDDDGDELHAAAVATSATAPAMQAVRTDLSRKLTAFTYS